MCYSQVTCPNATLCTPLFQACVHTEPNTTYTLQYSAKQVNGTVDACVAIASVYDANLNLLASSVGNLTLGDIYMPVTTGEFNTGEDSYLMLDMQFSCLGDEADGAIVLDVDDVSFN